MSGIPSEREKPIVSSKSTFKKLKGQKKKLEERGAEHGQSSEVSKRKVLREKTVRTEYLFFCKEKQDPL